MLYLVTWSLQNQEPCALIKPDVTELLFTQEARSTCRRLTSSLTVLIHETVVEWALTLSYLGEKDCLSFISHLDLLI